MTVSKIDEFKMERERLDKFVMKYTGTPIKRFYGLNSLIYQDGALPKKVKEMVGFVASLVLRCDDCIRYHILQCREEGVKDDEIEEMLGIGLVVGGTITIPHFRRAFEAWDELKRGKKS